MVSNDCRFRRRQLLGNTKSGAGLVIAQHRPGRLPTWIHFQTSRELLHEVLIELNLDHPEILAASQIAFKKSNGNIREVLREMYDRFSEGEFTGQAIPSWRDDLVENQKS
jgi:hypothetical protein